MSWNLSSGFMWSSATSAPCTARETASRYSPALPRASEMLTKGMRNPFRGGGICSASRAYPLEGVKKAEVETALGYFAANAPRMRYHWFRCGLFVGSGVV